MGDYREMDKLVSVIIPTYKGANKLSRAIESVLNQTYQTIEIIVVDDNDPLSVEREETEKVMNKYNKSEIMYIRHELNKNGAAARNTGIQASNGDYICFLDDDDFYLPDRIQKSLEKLDEHPLFDAVYCGVILTRNDTIIGIKKAKRLLEKKNILLNEMAIGTGSNIFISRNVIEKIREFDEAFTRHQDLEFMLRILNYFNVINLDTELIVKASNGTNNIPEYKELLAAKKLFFKKFKHDIYELEEEERQQFFSYHYNYLLKSALKSDNKTYIKQALRNVEQYRVLSPREKIRKYFNESIYESLRGFYRIFRSPKVEKPNDNQILEVEIDQHVKEFVGKFL